jgi:hypothetical protein
MKAAERLVRLSAASVFYASRRSFPRLGGYSTLPTACPRRVVTLPWWDRQMSQRNFRSV